MERKIMSAGKSSLVVSLPKEWTPPNELKKGDLVSYNIQRNRHWLFIQAPSKKLHLKK